MKNTNNNTGSQAQQQPPQQFMKQLNQQQAQTPQQQEEQIKIYDIVQPEFTSSFFPLSIGFQVLIFVLTFSFLFFSVYIVKRIRRYRARNVALKYIQSIDSINFSDLSVLLKRVAMHYHKKKEIAPLTGDKWLIRLKMWSRREDHYLLDHMFSMLYRSKKDISDPVEIEKVKNMVVIIIKNCSKKGAQK